MLDTTIFLQFFVSMRNKTFCKLLYSFFIYSWIIIICSIYLRENICPISLERVTFIITAFVKETMSHEIYLHCLLLHLCLKTKSKEINFFFSFIHVSHHFNSFPEFTLFFYMFENEKCILRFKSFNSTILKVL